MTMVFEGPEGVNIYRAVALKMGLKLYMNTGMRPNRAWTPTNMLRTAGAITGKTYKRRAYAEAIADLETWLKEKEREPDKPEPFTCRLCGKTLDEPCGCYTRA